MDIKSIKKRSSSKYKRLKNVAKGKRFGFTKNNQASKRIEIEEAQEVEIEVISQTEETEVKRFYRPSIEEAEECMEETRNGILQVRNIDTSVVKDKCYLRPKDKLTDSNQFYEKYLGKKTRPEERNILYALLHFQKTADLWNESFRQHIQKNVECQGLLEWDMKRSFKWGLCHAMALKCNTCNFESQVHKLYEEVIEDKKPGRKSASPNVSVQVAIARQGIGPAGFVDILHGMQMESPSLAGLYSASHRVCEKIVEANEADIKDKLKIVTDLNTRLGRDPKLLAVQADATYNNKLSSGVGKTPTQPATQATHLTIENNSPNKFIVHVGTYNKLCRSCPTGRHGGPRCTQTLADDTPPGNEGKYIRDAISALNKNKVQVGEVTMDGDSSANKVVQEIQQKDGPKISCQRCIRHLSQTIRLAIKSSSFSISMFPGCTAEQRKAIQGRFSMDIVQRGEAEAKHLCKLFKGDLPGLTRAAAVVPDMLIKCYQGDCSLCHKFSLVCSKKKPWNRPLLSTIKVATQGREIIRPNKSDSQTLKACLMKRFSGAGMEKTFKNQTSNKCEGCNRALVKALPKTLTFSRAYPGRANAAAHSVNNCPGRSLLMLCQSVGAPLPKCMSFLRSLKQQDKRYKAARILQKSLKYRMGLKEKRARAFKLYDDQKAETYYKKGQADTDGAIPSTSGEPRPARLTTGRKEQATSLLANFGSQGWDHSYHLYPRK